MCLTGFFFFQGSVLLGGYQKLMSRHEKDRTLVEPPAEVRGPGSCSTQRRGTGKETLTMISMLEIGV
jgi:hypothetical protein